MIYSGPIKIVGHVYWRLKHFLWSSMRNSANSLGNEHHTLVLLQQAFEINLRSVSIGMAVFSHSFVSATAPILSRSVSKFSPSKPLPYCRNPRNGSGLTSVVSAIRKNTISLASDSDENSRINSVLDSLLVVCASAALSLALFITDVDPASAFVVTPSRKLQSDELATVRLFKENTPSVVYITNLAAKYEVLKLLLFL